MSATDGTPLAAIGLALLASACFGTGLITTRFGMRGADARGGAAISVPTAAVFFACVSVFALDVSAFDARAAAIFAAVGLFFPAAVTLINFVSTERLGPALTGSIGGTSPAFGIVAALVVLGEPIPSRALPAVAAIVAGVALMSWARAGPARAHPGWLLALPVAGAAIRGLAQVFAKLGLAWWPSPLAATLIGYLASATVLTIAARTRRRRPAARPDARTVALFVATGLLNGLALLLSYLALRRAPVALVSPIVACYPIFTLGLAALLIRDERIGARSVAGALLTIAAVGWLVSG